MRNLALALFLPALLAPALAGEPHSEAPAAPGSAGGPGLALRADKILTAARSGAQVIDHGLVLVKDGRIEAVGTQRELAIPEGYELLDLSPRWLMPGMVELHNHIGPASPFFPNDINDMVYLTNPGLRASPSIRPDTLLQRFGVAGGVTTALFIPGSGTNIGGQGVVYKLGPKTYEEMEVRNPGSLKLAQAGNPERWVINPGRSFMNWNTRNTFLRGLAYARRWQAHERDGAPRPEKDIQLEIFRHLLDGSAQVSTHTQIFQVVLMTITMVARDLGLPTFIDHGSFDGFRAAALAEAHGVQAILGPRQIATTYTNFIDTDGKILGMAAEYQSRGHTMIGFNTDCVDNGGFGITPPQEELSLQSAMAVRYGFDPTRLDHIRGLTIVPAITIGLADRVGSIEAGKDADLLVLRGDPTDPRTSIERVFVDGRLVYDRDRDGRRW